jgi:ribosomal protein L19
MTTYAANPRGNSGGSRRGLTKFVERVNAPQMKDDLIPFRVGMTCKVGVTVVEGGKSRVQPYEGIIIAIHRAGVATTITVRKSFQGYGVERIFPIHSPLCTFEEVRGAGKPKVRVAPARRLSLSLFFFFFSRGRALDRASTARASRVRVASVERADAPASTEDGGSSRPVEGVSVRPFPRSLAAAAVR